MNQECRQDTKREKEVWIYIVGGNHRDRLSHMRALTMAIQLV